MRATWNPNEPIERNPVRWVARRWKRLLAAEKAIAFLPFAWMLVWSIALSVPAMWPIGLVLSVFIGFGLMLQPGNSGFIWQKSLVDDPSSVKQVYVDLLVKRPHLLLGEDHGYLCEVDGWLVYTGNRTSFAIQPQHCRVVNWTRSDWDDVFPWRRSWVSLHLRDRSETEIRFRTHFHREEDDLFEMGTCWRDDPTGHVKPVFPPDSPHEDAFIRERARGYAMAVLFVLWLTSWLVPLSSLSDRLASPDSSIRYFNLFWYGCLPIYAGFSVWRWISNLRRLTASRPSRETQNESSAVVIDAS